MEECQSGDADALNGGELFPSVELTEKFAVNLSATQVCQYFAATTGV